MIFYLHSSKMSQKSSLFIANQPFTRQFCQIYLLALIANFKYFYKFSTYHPRFSTSFGLENVVKCR